MKEGWYHHWVPKASLDDQLWYQILVMDRVLESLRGSEQGTNDAMMWTLLRWGVIDVSGEDSPWDGSTQSMRYSAVLVGCLWGLLAGERTRVSVIVTVVSHDYRSTPFFILLSPTHPTFVDLIFILSILSCDFILSYPSLHNLYLTPFYLSFKTLNYSMTKDT